MPDFRSRLRHWLGLIEITSQLHDLNQLLTKRNDQLAVQNLALGRIIAKLDPAYNQDYLDPGVRRASDDLGRQVIARLFGEYHASNPGS